MGHPPLDPAAQRRHKLRNVAQAVLLMAAMVAMLALSAWLIAGTTGVVAVGVVAGVTLVVRPRVPPTWVLRMYGARPLPVAAAPDLHRLVAALAERARLPRPPRLYYVPTRMLNAFAVGGRDEAAIGSPTACCVASPVARWRGCSLTRSATSAPTTCGS